MLPTAKAASISDLKDGDSFFSLQAKLLTSWGLRSFSNAMGPGISLGLTLLDASGLLIFFLLIKTFTFIL